LRTVGCHGDCPVSQEEHDFASELLAIP